MSQQIGFEPFFKPGQKVKILPMTQRMRRYSASRYYEGDLGEVIGLSDQITIKLDEPDSKCYRYKVKFGRQTWYVLESMMMPVGTVNKYVDKDAQMLDENGNLTSCSSLPIIRAMGYYNGAHHFYINVGAYERIAKYYNINL